ncbi:Cation channel sperm-associated protein 4 [Lobulomyces angularis]|nr:Cation channel sperm-associated protein 4 [Lobulomyces angularis]
MFIWSLVGVSLFSTVDYHNFGDIGKTMFTLYVVITGDGWEDIYHELAHHGYFVESSFFFGSFLTIGTFILQQVIVAIVVANLEDSQHKINLKKKKAKQIFKSEIKSTTGQKRFLRPIVPKPSNKSKIWMDQIPYEIPNFDNISIAKLERYFLVLSIIEDNMYEYLELKSRLHAILNEVQIVNENVVESKENIGEEDENFVKEEGDAITQLLTGNKEITGLFKP